MECPVYAKLYPKILPIPVRAILRIILGYNDRKISPDLHEEFLDLSYPKEIYDDDENEEANDHFMMAQAVLKYGNINDLDEDYVEQFFGRVSLLSTILHRVLTLRLMSVVECKFVHSDKRLWQKTRCIPPSRRCSLQSQLRPQR